ncbi:MAG: 1-deoxy-D-xylulose-5-phosphate reductoisomerase [Candidatus Poribacteria bacterium]|nr:1-deoxy-D-xylulose-5-phosphate reductoisomerase [Candidatus Poribacteria bacterium]
MKTLSILGSTGSIGQNALSVVETHSDEFLIAGLAANTSVDLMEKQVRQFRPRLVALNNREAASQLRERLRDLSKKVEILSGPEGILAIATMEEVDLVLEGMGGGVGLLPTLEAIKAGKDLAFVNKEVLVMCGSLVMEAVRTHGVRLLPVDGEMSAIFQCLVGRPESDQSRDGIHRLVLTASGGPFRQTPLDQLYDVTPQQALKHPNWKMGNKITIDSATMMNKGLEVIEAKWLFDVELSQIEVIIHPESIIHSMVEFVDGSFLAQLSVTDMRVLIQYALTYPRRLPTPLPRLKLSQIRALHLESVDFDKFPCLGLAYTAARVGGTMPTVLSSADEVVVRAFLNQQIGFMDIPSLLAEVIARHDVTSRPNLDDILAADRWAKSVAHQLIQKRR